MSENDYILRKRTGKEAVEVYFNVLSWNSP